jgi:hypothetical protein
MYPLGVLFGLGFDTATEIALLVIASTGAVAGLPWYAILCLPVLFAAGMSLLDTIDGYANTLQGRIAAGSGAVHFGLLRSAINALHFRADGAALRVEATLMADEVEELLNIQRLAQIFR